MVCPYVADDENGLHVDYTFNYQLDALIIIYS